VGRNLDPTLVDGWFGYSALKNGKLIGDFLEIVSDDIEEEEGVEIYIGW